MMMRTCIRASLLSAFVLAVAVPASAQVVHSINFGGGFFFPRAFDSRVAGDVWVADLTQPVIFPPDVTGSLDFDRNLSGPLSDDVAKFKSFPLFVEWNMGFGKHIEVGVGFAYSNRKVSSLYRDLRDSKGTATLIDDTDIEQDLRLQTYPLTGVVRFIVGPATGVQGYAGGGVAAIPFKYSEVGEFVDTADFSIFPARYSVSSAAFGGLILGGARFALGGDVYAITVEGRYVWANGKTGGQPDFLGEKIDLGGATINFGFLIRF